MPDIATLGLAIDSTQVKNAAGALANFASAAKPAASAAKSVEDASRGLEKALASQVKQINASTTQTGLARHELINLGRQAQDVGVSLVSGQSPFMVLAQQGAQIFDIFSSTKGTMGGFGSQLAALVTPARLLAGGIALAATAAVAASISWKNFGTQLDDTRRIAGETSTEMAKLQAAASFKGIDNAEFGKGVASFSEQIYQARANMGGLVEVLRGNGLSAVGDFSTLFGRVADLVARAKGDTQLQISILRQSGLPTTMEFVRFMEQGANGIKRAKEEAAAFGGEMNDAMIKRAREFDEAWNKAWTNFGRNARNGIVVAAEGIDGLFTSAREKLTQFAIARGKLTPSEAGAIALRSGAGTPTTGDFGAFYKGTGAPGGSAPKSPLDPEVVKNDIARMQTYLGLLGQTMTAEEARLQVQKQLEAAAANGIYVDKQRAEVLKQLAYDQQLGITAIRSQADAYNVEAGAIGMSAGKAAEYTALLNALNDAKRNGRLVTDEQVAALQREAGALGEAAQRADLLRTGYETVRGAFQTFTSAQGATAMDALKKAGQSALNSIASKLADMASQGLWSAAFGGKGGGGLGGGLFSLFGGGGGAGDAGEGVGAAASSLFASTGLHSGGMVGKDATFTRNIHPAYFDDAPRFHGGGLVSDEVPIIAKKGEGVFTPEQMRALAPVGSGSSGNTTNITNNYSFVGVEPGMEARLKAYIDQGDRRSVNQSVEAVAKEKGRSPSYLRS